MQPTTRTSINPAPLVQPTGPFLRYLFVAELSDGSLIAQTPEDKSELAEGKSAFYDVLQREDDIVRFHLQDGVNWYTVDLRDGLFEVNGMPFYAHSQFQVPELPLHLIYFRETVAERRGDGSQNHFVNRYFIGWWYKKEGEKIEQTIAFE